MEGRRGKGENEVLRFPERRTAAWANLPRCLVTPHINPLFSRQTLLSSPFPHLK